MNLGLVIDRLAPLKPDVLKVLDGAMKFDVKSLTAPAYPAVYVLPSSDRPDPANDSRGAAQAMQLRFELAIGVAASSDVTGADAHDVLTPVRDAIRGRLFGWKPLPRLRAVICGGGQILSFQPGRLWWLDTYVTGYYVTEKE